MATFDKMIAGNWWVTLRHPFEIWEKHPSYLILEIAIYFLALLTIKHAFRLGGRYIYLWVAIVLHGLTVESVSYVLPDIDNFWHAQSMIMFLGKRLPLHIVAFYPVFLYTAAVAVSRMRLKKWAEPFMMGLAVVLLDVPFDIMGIKLLWWTWHDTDPHIYDRHYWVPWTSYYFHAAFASSFSFLFHGSRKILTKKSGYQSDSFLKEVLCCIIPGLFSFPLGVLQFIPIYHGLHDNLNIHTEVCVLIFLAVYVLIIWCSDRNPSSDARPRPKEKTRWFDELTLHVLVHYALYIILVIVEKPENNRVTGLHEPIGDCNALTPVHTAIGQVFSKRSYFCVDDYHEDYLDFHCLPGGKAPKAGAWYTICGTPFPDHMEYIVVVTSFALFGLFVYIQMLLNSGKDLKTRVFLKKQKAH